MCREQGCFVCQQTNITWKPEQLSDALFYVFIPGQRTPFMTREMATYDFS